MALAPLNAATKPIKSVGLFDATGGKTFEQWAKSAAPGATMPSIAPAQVDDSVANRVSEITGENSTLMRAAQTEGLKIANRRGLLNSSTAVGASQRAVLDAALPIASQDAATAANKNAAARAFEYSMAAQDDAQGFAGQQAALDRSLQQLLQTKQIESADRQQIRQIASTEGLAAAERALQDRMQLRDIESREGLAAAQRALDERMQRASIAAAEQQQIRAIASNEGIAAADRALTDRLAASAQQFEAGQRGLDRATQERLSRMDLDSSDRNAAATMLVQMESLYQQRVDEINSNTALDAPTRTAYLTSARNLRDTQLDFVQQMFDVDLDWAEVPLPSTPSAPAPSSSTVLCTHFHAKGWLSDEIYEADRVYARDNITDAVWIGYHSWAVPLVIRLETGAYPVSEWIIGQLVKRWAAEMAYRAAGIGRGSLTGKALMAVGVPLCAAIGHFLKRRNRTVAA